MYSFPYIFLGICSLLNIELKKTLPPYHKTLEKGTLTNFLFYLALSLVYTAMRVRLQAIIVPAYNCLAWV